MSNDVDRPNQDQFEYWNEKAGPQWVKAQSILDGSLATLTDALYEGAGLEAGMRVLDVGCGTGQTTVELARRVAPGGSSLGIDLSAVMLEAAAARSEAAGVAADYRQADAQTAELEQAHFDRVVSRFGVMFFEDSTVAFENLRRATHPDGSLCFLCWQAPGANPWVAEPLKVASRFVELPPAEPGAPGPFAFADRERIETVLEGAGWKRISIESRTGQMRFGDGSTGFAVEFMSRIGPMSRVMLDLEDRASVRDELVEALRELMEEQAAKAEDGKVSFGGSTWLVTAAAS